MMAGTRQRHLSDFEKDHGVGLSDPDTEKEVREAYLPLANLETWAASMHPSTARCGKVGSHWPAALVLTACPGTIMQDRPLPLGVGRLS